MDSRDRWKRCNSIKNNTYPFVANVYVSIRSDLDKSSMTYKLYEWLQTESGKDVINESGYVPYGDYSNGIISSPRENDISIYPNPVKDGFYCKGIQQTTQLNLVDYLGRKVFFKMIINNDYIDISHLSQGIYIVDISTRGGNKQYKIVKE